MLVRRLRPQPLAHRACELRGALSAAELRAQLGRLLPFLELLLLQLKQQGVCGVARRARLGLAAP